MIGSNLYVGDFGDYQADELFKFQSNFNLQLWFFWGWGYYKIFPSERWEIEGPGPTYAMTSDCYSLGHEVILARPWDRALCHYSPATLSQITYRTIISSDFTQIIYFQYDGILYSNFWCIRTDFCFSFFFYILWTHWT